MAEGVLRYYRGDEFDMLACVALDCRRIAYFSPSKFRQTIHVRQADEQPKGGGKTFPQYPFDLALAEMFDVR